jgi:hypothetical protein
MSDSAGKPALKKGWYVDGEDRTRDKFWNGQAFTKTRKTKDPERAPRRRRGRAARFCRRQATASASRS